MHGFTPCGSFLCERKDVEIVPELVEVETAKRILEPQLSGCMIDDVEIGLAKVIRNCAPEEFRRCAIGSRFDTVLRRGKFLIFNMVTPEDAEPGAELKFVVHFRMTGVLLITLPGYEQIKHTHVVFKLSGAAGDKRELRYIDQRRFGGIWIVRTGTEFAATGIGELGAEATDDTLSADYLRERLAKRGTAIKTGLLDQHVIAGLGNIYTDEVLFRSGIIPTRPCSSLTYDEWRRLAREIPQMMRFMIDKNQISPADYLAGRGIEYRNTPFLQVYNRAGEPCIRCGRPLERTTIAGRSSVYCRHCQK